MFVSKIFWHLAKSNLIKGPNQNHGDSIAKQEGDAHWHCSVVEKQPQYNFPLKIAPLLQLCGLKNIHVCMLYQRVNNTFHGRKFPLKTSIEEKGCVSSLTPWS